MHKFFALSLIASLLSVTSIPLLPAAPYCTHAIEDVEEHASCHEDSAELVADDHAMSDGMPNDMPNDMDMSDMSLDDDSSDVVIGHGHDSELSDLAKECRIECGCGCNRSLDGFPQVLAPHMTPHIYIDESMVILLAKPLPISSLIPFVETVAIPPPRLI